MNTKVVHLAIAGLAVALLGIPAGAVAAPETTVSFSVADVSFSEKEGYDVVEVQGCHLAGEPGHPWLPCMAVNFVIPRDKVVSAVRVQTSGRRRLFGRYYIYPAQPDWPVGGEGDFVEPDAEVYGSAEPYPGVVVEEGEEMVAWGWNTYQVMVWPLEYIPVKRELWLYGSIDISLELVDGQESSQEVLGRTQEEHERWAYELEQVVVNPDDVWRWAPEGAVVEGLVDHKWVLILPGPPEEGEERGWYTTFEPLISWRQQQGYVTEVAYAEQISPGLDLQEIRSYLQNQKQQGATWACLVGDHEMIPWSYDNPGHGWSIPHDWCYCDLDGSWPGDADWTPELWVGRVPCLSPEEAGNFIDKVLLYEQDPGYGDHGYLYRALYVCADVCQYYGTCEQVVEHQDPAIDETIWGELPSYNDPDPYFPWDYQIVEELSTTHYNYFTVHCHGGPEMFACLTSGNGGATISAFGPADVEALWNTGFYFLWYSISCDNAMLDYQNPSLRTLAETSTCVYPERCAIAFAGNTRYGWVFSSTDLQCCAWDYLFPEGPCRQFHNHAGHVEAMSKWRYDRLGYPDEYVCYSHNLFGDPATGIWTPKDQPVGKPLVAEGPAVPLQIGLVACSPNPAMSEAALKLSLSRAADVRVSVYDITGRLVQQVHQGVLEPGVTTKRWDCSQLRSGVYTVRVEAEGLEATTKAVVLR